MKSEIPGLVSLEIRDEIVFARYANDVDLDLEKAKKIVEKRLELQKGKSYPVLIYVNLKSATKEARMYMKNEGTEKVVAGAFIPGNVYSLSLTNFFIAILKPKVPSKMFKNEAEALNWLEQYKK